MKILFRTLLVSAVLLCAPLAVMAASGSQGHDHGHGHHAPAATVDGGAVEIGSQTVKGIHGTATLLALPVAETQATHRFAITLSEVGTLKPFACEKIVLKVTDPDAKPIGPIDLSVQNGVGSADLTMDKQGEFHFRIDVSAGGQLRKYHFHYVIR